MIGWQRGTERVNRRAEGKRKYYWEPEAVQVLADCICPVLRVQLTAGQVVEAERRVTRVP